MIKPETTALVNREIIEPESENEDLRAIALFYELLERTLSKLFPPGTLHISFDNKIFNVSIYKNENGEIVLETY